MPTGTAPRAVAAALLVFSFIVSVTASAAPAQPAGFVENAGQWNAQARFQMVVGQAAGAPPTRLDLWLTDSGYVYSLRSDASRRGHAVALRFLNAGRAAIEPSGQLPGTRNWLGRDRDVTGTRAWSRVTYRGVYPGIDLTFDAANPSRVMETTWDVAPGVDPASIALTIDGADRAVIDAAGRLVLSTSLGEITELHPVAFQRAPSGRLEPVDAAFTLDGSTLRFRLGAYDPKRPLLIDPVVQFSRTFGGGGTDSVADMHEDATGRYVTGATASTDLPLTAGKYDTARDGSSDWYACKFNLANDTLLWCTYVGGTGGEFGGASDLAPNGELVLAGSTTDPASFPSTHSYLQGGSSVTTAALFRLSADGATRISAAIYGSTSGTNGTGVKIAPSGDVYVTGRFYATASPWTNLGSTNGGYATDPYGGYDAFVARFTSDFSSLLNASRAGTSGEECGQEVAFDAGGNVYVSGVAQGVTGWPATIGPAGNYDVFVVKFSADLLTRHYETLVGGGSTEPTPGIGLTTMPDYYYQTTGESLVIDASNRAWVTGMTASSDWPTTPGAYRTTNAGNYDVFVTALNAAGNALDYSTLLGGVSTDGGRGIALDPTGRVFVAGLSASSNFPVTAAAPQPANAGSYDWIVSVFSQDLSELLFSTYWGGTGSDYGQALVLGPADRVRVAGVTLQFPQRPDGSTHFGTAGGYEGGVASFDLQPDLTVVKTAGTDGRYWVIRVANEGGSVAEFVSGQRILIDNMPAADYAEPVLQNVLHLTGEENVRCSITANNLTCRAALGSVSIAGGGSFEVLVPFDTPERELVNPRDGGVLQVDPDGAVTDGTPSNNTGTSAAWAYVFAIPLAGPAGLAALALLLAIGALVTLRR